MTQNSPLSAFLTPFFLTLAIATMFGTIRTLGNSKVVAPFDATWLIELLTSK